MKNFEYAQPATEADAVKLLSATGMKTAVLAGGTDLVGLLKRMIATPDRVVDIGRIASLRGIHTDGDQNVWIGANTSLDEFLDDPQTDLFASAKQIIQGISSIQLRAQGTLVGELLRRPMCWYFRDGHGLLASGGQMVIDGDNRYHAILGNRGPAKFVNASRLAPALIALDAHLRVIGPAAAEEERFLRVQDLFQTPAQEGELEHCLAPGELVTHIVLPPQRTRLSAAYEVRHGEGPDQPLAAAAVSFELQQGRVQAAEICLGQVAPTPWRATAAARQLEGQPVNESTAEIAGAESVAGATPLSENAYKVQLAQVAVKRALLRAAGLETGGLDRPQSGQATQPATSESHLV